MRRSIQLTLMAFLGAAAVLGFVTMRHDAPMADPPLPGDLPGADPAFARLIADARADVLADRRDPDRWTRLGMILEANDLYEPARTSYEQSVALRDSDGRTWYHLALVRQQLGDMPGALAAMRRAAAAAPGYAPAHWRSGLWCLEIGALDEADEALHRAAAMDPNDPAPMHLMARLHLARQENAEAAALLEQLAGSPSAAAPYTWQLLGTAYRRIGRVSDAEAALARGQHGQANWNDPWQAEIRSQFRIDVGFVLEMAKAFMGQGRVDEAIASLEQLHRLHPDRADVLNNLGTAYIQRGRLDAALRCFSEAAERSPDDGATQFNLALAHRHLGEKDPGDAAANHFDEALRHADRAVALNPAHAQAHGLRGALLARRGDLDAAMQAYREAETADPRSPWWAYRMAELLLQRGRTEEAIDRLQALTVRAPMFDEGFYMLGRALLQVRRLREAEAALRRAVELDPRQPEYGRLLRELVVPGGTSP
jgi:tetratricopeptide (TPR) repeat protein